MMDKRSSNFKSVDLLSNLPSLIADQFFESNLGPEQTNFSKNWSKMENNEVKKNFDKLATAENMIIIHVASYEAAAVTDVCKY